MTDTARDRFVATVHRSTPMKKALLILTRLVMPGAASTALAAGDGKSPAMPDFTEGAAIPAKAAHDWNLGPTGLRGWMFGDKLVTSGARQIAVTRVEPASPAEVALWKRGASNAGYHCLGMMKK
jgi:hypothetical protein